MSIALYELQNSVSQCCAIEVAIFRQPGVMPKLVSVFFGCVARVVSASVVILSLGKEIRALSSKVIKMVSLLREGAVRGFVRCLVFGALWITLIAFRILSSLMGLVIPELVFGLAHIERLLLKLGVLGRLQLIRLDRYDIALHGLQDITFRFRLCQHICSYIEQQEYHKKHPRFVPLLERALHREIGAHPMFRGIKVPLTYVHGSDGKTLYQDFKDLVVASIERGVVEALKVYDSDTIATMEANVLYAIYDWAVWSVLSTSARVEPERLFLLYNGHEYEVKSGPLFARRQLISEFKAALAALSDSERSLLPLYLFKGDNIENCTIRESQRIQELPPRTEGVNACCLKLVAIRTLLVEQALGSSEYSFRLQKAFVGNASLQ